MLRLLERLANLLYAVSRVMITGGLAGIVLLVAWQVFTRYVLNAAAVWTSELATFLLIWTLYLGASMAMRDKEMVAITILVERLPPAAGHIANLLVNLVLGTFLVTMVVLNQEIIELSRTTPMPVMRFSKIWVHLALSVGFALTTYYIVLDSLRSLVVLRDLARGSSR